MSEIGLNINVDSYNNEGIKTIKGNNNAEIYKLYILKNKRRLSLVGKTVKLGYVMAGTTKGDIVENLNITNAEQGEITFPITNRISKQDGVYSCQLAIYGADEFLEYTATFGLTVEDNIFTKIAGEIENSKDLTYIERILEEAKTVSGDLKTNIPVATNLNSSLENNISNARNINTTLADTTEKSKVAATDAIEKKSQLEKSITKAKEFIDGLDGSQDIPSIRMELTELQNGLKSNQALAYQGSSISANDTLEGRTEGMRIGGRTLRNLFSGKVKDIYTPSSIRQEENGYVTLLQRRYGDCIHTDTSLYKPNTKYTLIIDVKENTLDVECSLINDKRTVYVVDNSPTIKARETGVTKHTFTTINDFSQTLGNNKWGFYLQYNQAEKEHKGNITLRFILLEGDWTDKPIPQYFEGLKSFGEAEKEGNKYKISILSHNKNFIKLNELDDWNSGSLKPSFKCNNGEFSYSVGENDKVGWAIEKKISIKKGVNLVLSLQVKSTFTDGGSGWVGIYYRTGSKWSYFGNYITPNTAYRKFEFKGVVPNEAEECVLRIYNYSQKSGTSYFKDIQVEEGEVATSYEVYKGDKKDILISAPLPGFDFGEDIMYEENGQVKVTRNIDNYIFTGDETMRDTTEQDEKSGTGKYKVFALTVNKTIDINKNINNNFPKKQFNVAFQNMDSEGLAVTQYGVYIKILKSKLSTQDTEGFKAWLKANTTTIYFARATPVTEIVENCIDIDLDTFQEKTYFNILNSLPGTLDFKVPSNIGSLVQSNAKEINNINEFINNFILKALLEMNKDLAAIKIKNGLN